MSARPDSIRNIRDVPLLFEAVEHSLRLDLALGGEVEDTSQLPLTAVLQGQRNDPINLESARCFVKS